MLGDSRISEVITLTSKWQLKATWTKCQGYTGLRVEASRNRKIIKTNTAKWHDSVEIEEGYSLNYKPKSI